MKKTTGFLPDWIDTSPVAKSFRSIFKYGDPQGFSHPNQRMYNELKRSLGLSDEDFLNKVSTGNETINIQIPVGIERHHVAVFQDIVGNQNVSSDIYDRIKYSTGKTAEEAFQLRQQQVGKLTDVVVHPRNKKEIEKLVKYCNDQVIPIYVFGGGSSVTLGFYPEKGGVTLVLNTHLNQITEFNEINQTVTVQAGMLGPAFENALNNAPQVFNTKKAYTGGHFPQSFEYSSVGGWFVTLGSGQQSSYYGDAVDLVAAVEIVTPSGTIKTLDYPATASGPKVMDMIAGSEGIFGIVVELTWKIYHHQPQNRQYMSFIFPNWVSAVDASREVSQGEFGMPAVFRISDAEETDFGLKLYGIEDTIIDKLMKLKGYKPNQRCLCIATADGSKQFAKNVGRQTKAICKKYGAMSLGAKPAKNWEKSRFHHPYMREDLMDFGLLIDTLETGVKWDNLHEIHQKVNEFIRQRPNTLSWTHASHFYPQGTNLYFIFLLKENDYQAFRDFQRSIINSIIEHGGSPSHHHGVGRMTGAYMENYLGKEKMDVLRALKKHFDPNNIMNPGGQMGIT